MTLKKRENTRKYRTTGGRGRRHKQLLDDLKEKRGYWNLKVEVIDRPLGELALDRSLGGSQEPCLTFFFHIFYTLHRSCLLKHVIEGKIEGRVE
jgi:hypothetical protein